jgi:hypothetical protein
MRHELTKQRGIGEKIRACGACVSLGLDVNNPEEQYTLRSIPGKFSGLHLLCIQYVGFQIIEPSLDLGFDLSAEYDAARGMHKGPQ